MNRGIARAPIYLIDDDYEIFLEVLKESSKYFQVYLSAYCLMPNHYHLLLETPRGNLSRFMRHVDGVYTQRHNRYHKKDGHLFRGRYKAILVQEDAYLTHLVRYLHLNPVQANLVQDPKDWRWSSHGYYLNGKNEEWLKVTRTLLYFSKTMRMAKKAYLDFLKDGIDPKTKAFFSSKKLGPVFGDLDFIETIKEKFLVNEGGVTKEIPETRPFQGDYLVNRIKKEVAKRFKISESSFVASRRGMSNSPRTLAMALAREVSGLQLKELAKHFNVGSYKTINAHHSKVMRLIKKDPKARRTYEALIEVISK